MHIFFKHFCVNKILTTKFVNFLFADEFILIINYFLLLFLELLGDVLNIWYPFWSWTKLRYKETAYFRIFKCCKNHSTVGYNCTHVNTMLWLDTGKEMTFTVRNFYLFFVTENNILIIIVQEVN